MRRIALAVLVLAVVDFGQARAQACLGSAAGDGQIDFGVGFSGSAEQASYGVGVDVNLAGPLSFGASYSVEDYDNIDNNGTSLGGSLAFELPVSAVSICPRIGIGYSLLDAEYGSLFRGTPIWVDANNKALTVPLGLEIGKQFDLNSNVRVIPSVGAAVSFAKFSGDYVWYNNQGDAILGGDIDETDTAIGGGLSLLVGWRATYFSVGVSDSTVEDSDPSIGFALGIVVP